MPRPVDDRDITTVRMAVGMAGLDMLRHAPLFNQPIEYSELLVHDIRHGKPLISPEDGSFTDSHCGRPVLHRWRFVQFNTPDKQFYFTGKELVVLLYTSLSGAIPPALCR